MIVDNFEEPLEPPLLSESTEFLRTLEFAAGVIVDFIKNIDEEDLDNTIVNINAGKLYDLCEAFLDYAEVYEEFPSEELVDMVQTEKSMGAYKFYSDEEH